MTNKKLLVFASFALILAGCNTEASSESSLSEESSLSIQESLSNEESIPTEESSSNEESSTPIDVTDISSETSEPTTDEIPILEEDSIQFHYYRNDENYEKWSLWLWHGSAEGKQYEFNYTDDFGAVASYALSEIGVDVEKSTLGFIVCQLPSWKKDVSDDRFVDFNTLEKDENGVYHVYLYTGDANIYTNPNKNVADKILSAQFTDTSTAICKTNNKISHYEIIVNGTVVKEEDVNGLTQVTYKIDDAASFDYGASYSIKVTFADSKNELEQGFSVQKLFSSTDFIRKYYYTGELGAIYSSAETTFKVWSPVSSKIILKVYDNGTPTSVNASIGSDSVYKEVEMTKGNKGVFETTLTGDLQGKYYTYTVFNSQNPSGTEVIDPYAKSAGVNGIRGMIVDFSKTNPEGWDEISAIDYDRKELTVWETHVADVTSSDTWTGTEANRNKFLGVIESGTTYTKGDVTVTTGFDHIKELGVNAVQFVPIYDQANDEINTSFNWGYNPLNYNVLEGSYSSNPHDGYARIKEFKEVVKTFNDNGINVIMDVVYNHTAGLKGNQFDVLMPGYYYRYDNNGNAYNGSGCGNETASNNAMFRKFMIDSATFWAKEYKLGGFRFDLMALHDIGTMNDLTAACKKINPNIAIYGESWAGGTSGLDYKQACSQENGNSFVGYGQFNDRIRDELIKGGLNAVTAKSWVSDTNSTNNVNMTTLTEGIRGVTKAEAFAIEDPDKSIAYVTCHDNYTLFDRFKAAGIDDDAEVKKMAMLANSVVFTSQGTTFMLAGEEFLRTKQGNGNSYNASYEVNELDYELKVDNLDMFENYKKLISLKQNVDGLHLDADGIKSLTINTADNNCVIKYTIKDTTNNVEYYIIHSNGVNPTSRTAIDLTGYTLYLDTLNKLSGELTTVTPEAFQTIIAYKSL